MIMFVSLFICLLFFAIGDYFGVLTKAKLSSVFVALLLFLIGFMTKILPSDIIKLAGLSEMAKWSSPVLVFHMGTMINIRELIDNWRTVVMNIIAMVVAVISTFLVISFIGREAAIVTIPIINGGIIATNIMTQAALAKGLNTVAALGTLVYAIQKFVGTPPASYFGMKEANLILADYRANKTNFKEKKENTEHKKNTNGIFFRKYEKYYTMYICIAISIGMAAFSVLIQEKIKLNASIVALLLGAILNQLGLVPNNILDRAKASGILSMAVFASLIPSLATLSFGELLTLGWQIIIIFISFLVMTYIFLYLIPTWKVVGSKNLAMGIAMTQLLGFPATFLIANEIATAVAENEEEKKVVLDKITPVYVIGGLVSVTSLSIVIAGIFATLL
ncbi:MAG: hypothetical protein ACRCSK_01850 [Fusobacteriaceae bacterium]